MKLESWVKWEIFNALSLLFNLPFILTSNLYSPSILVIGNIVAVDIATLCACLWLLEGKAMGFRIRKIQG